MGLWCLVDLITIKEIGYWLVKNLINRSLDYYNGSKIQSLGKYVMLKIKISEGIRFKEYGQKTCNLRVKI